MRQSTGPTLCRAVNEAVLLSALMLGPALATTDGVAVTIRSGNHPDFGRIVFDAPPQISYRVAREGDHVTVQFAGDAALSGDPSLPRNVTALHADHTQAVLTIAAGATLRDVRLGEHVVIDVFDPGPAVANPASEPASRRASPSAQGRPASKPAVLLAGASSSKPAPDQPVLKPVTEPTPPKPMTEQPASKTMIERPVSKPMIEQPASKPMTERPVSKPMIEQPASKPMTEQPPPKPAAATATPPGQSGPGIGPGQAKPSATGATRPASAGTNSLQPALKSASTGGKPAASPPAALPPAAVLPAVLPPASLRPLAASVAAPPPLPGPGASADPAASPPPTGPDAVVAAPVPLPAGTEGSAFALPFSHQTGAAAFRRRGETFIVFDDTSPIDLTALQSDPMFAGARQDLLPAGSAIRVTPPATVAVTLSRAPHGWTVAALVSPPPPQPIAPQSNDTMVNLVAREPGGVLAMADPLTGDTLLVGTQRQAGQAVVARRNTPQFALLPTTQGIVVAPLADTVMLRVIPNGFALTTAPDQLAVSHGGNIDTAGNAAALTRRFSFPDLPPDQLLRQLSADIAAAGAEPLLARGPKRRAAAISMISLGMNAEAEALLQLTAADDPRQGASADVVGLTAIAAMLAGRPAEAGGIDDPRLTGTDEIVLWRLLRTAMLDDASPLPGIAMASAARMLLTYPPAIRDRLLPLAVETMIQAGTNAAAKALLEQARAVQGLDLARAMLAQATGDTDAALRQYDALAASHDQSVRARASVRAVELRLTTGKFDTRQAAEALDRLLYTWRGDQHELALREKLAGLRQQLGEWRTALALLRDSEVAFPDDATAIHARLQASFDALLHDNEADRLPPLEFVALVDENADLVPSTKAGDAMQAILADKLLALDLPKRAGPVLDKLMRADPAGPGRAALGARLASLRISDADAAGALAALVASDAPDLPAELAEQRTLLRADAQAHSGDLAGAISALAGLNSPAADAARAGILEDAKDWVGADRALTAYVAKTVPESGDLDDAARRLLLRLATAAARAGDDATLAGLRAHQEARMGTGPLADMFRLLTADPVNGTADLARVGVEAGYVRALPANLQAMRP